MPASRAPSPQPPFIAIIASCIYNGNFILLADIMGAEKSVFEEVVEASDSGHATWLVSTAFLSVHVREDLAPGATAAMHAAFQFHPAFCHMRAGCGPPTTRAWQDAGLVGSSARGPGLC